MVSALDRARRALVGLLKTIAALYGVVESISRDSPDKDLRSAYRRISRKTHPDHGGDAEHQKSLNNAMGAWEEAQKASRRHGGDRRKGGSSADGAAQVPSGLPATHGDPKEKGKFRFQSQGILLTYQKFDDKACWKRFVTYVEGQLCVWKVRYWCATLETNLDGTFHLHLMLQFFRAQNRNTTTFAFEGVLPDGRPNDLLGEGWSGRKLQASLDRGFFYVWAAKEGTALDEEGLENQYRGKNNVWNWLRAPVSADPLFVSLSLLFQPTANVGVGGGGGRPSSSTSFVLTSDLIFRQVGFALLPTTRLRGREGSLRTQFLGVGWTP